MFSVSATLPARCELSRPLVLVAAGLMLSALTACDDKPGADQQPDQFIQCVDEWTFRSIDYSHYLPDLPTRSAPGPRIGTGRNDCTHESIAIFRVKGVSPKIAVIGKGVGVLGPTPPDEGPNK